MDKTRDRFDHHLPYEINMLILTYAWLRDVKPYTDQLLVNVFIESFCIHARVLMEFYKCSGPKFTNGKYIPPPTDKGSVFESFRGPLNKQIAHLDDGGRHIDPSKQKIEENMQLKLNNWLSDELESFKSDLKLQYKTPVLPQIPRFRDPGPAVNTATNAIMMTSSVTP